MDQKDKTYKRELAVALLVGLGAMYLWGIFGNPLAASAAHNLTAPIFIFVGGAFGLDAVLKGMK